MGKHAPDPGPQYMGAMLAAQQMAQQNATSQQQLDLARQAYQHSLPQTDAINAQILQGMTQQNQNAAADRARYESTFVPLENQYVSDAQNWDTPAREQTQAGAAEATVAQQTEAARQAAATALESYGVDPSSTRYAALDIGTRTGQAAAMAAAGNNAVNQTVQEGLALRANAINMGKGLPAQATSEFSSGTSAGNSAVGNTNSTTSTGFGAMGTGSQWGGLANSALGNLNSTLGNIYQQQTSQYNQSSGWGALAGLVGGTLTQGQRPWTLSALAAASGGTVPDDSDQTPGGAVPIQASPSGGKAVDDVPARLTPGEFVVPKDAVQWYGEKHFQNLIKKAREERPQAVATPQVQQAVPAAPTFISRPNPTGQALPLR